MVAYGVERDEKRWALIDERWKVDEPFPERSPTRSTRCEARLEASIQKGRKI